MVSGSLQSSAVIQHNTAGTNCLTAQGQSLALLLHLKMVSGSLQPSSVILHNTTDTNCSSNFPVHLAADCVLSGWFYSISPDHLCMKKKEKAMTMIKPTILHTTNTVTLTKTGTHSWCMATYCTSALSFCCETSNEQRIMHHFKRQLLTVNIHLSYPIQHKSQK